MIPEPQVEVELYYRYSIYGRVLPHFFFSAPWTVVGLCVNHIYRKKKLLPWELRDAIISVYNAIQSQFHTVSI